MKLIFSRKGFDSANGGVPSPILPDGSLCTLPIPSKESIRYGQVKWGNSNLGDIVSTLTGGRIDGQSTVHLDPDLSAASITRVPGWKPIFGQCAAAQSHLEAQGVGEGDLFLFFGWFRRTELVQGRLRFVPEAPDLHVLFGWLQVGDVRRVRALSPQDLPWARYHAHLQTDLGPLNTVYIAKETLSLQGGRPSSLPGAGVFPRFTSRLRLTAEGCTRSRWKLPLCLYPPGPGQALTYHSEPSRWERDGRWAYLKTVGRGQEFVLDCRHYPEVGEWLEGLFALTGQ